MEPFGIPLAAWVAVGAWLYHCFLHPLPTYTEKENKMPKYDCELTVSICKEVEADSEDEAKEKLYESLAQGAVDDEEFIVYGTKNDDDDDEEEEEDEEEEGEDQ